MRRIVAILNPHADRGRTAKLAESLHSALRDRLNLLLLTTDGRGAAVNLARVAATDGCDAVIAIGGDGTVHEVANGLMAAPNEQRPAMAILPAGSGNDVAYALSITKDPARLIELIHDGHTRPLDVGHVRTSTGRECFCINNVGTLLEGQVNLASHQLTWPKGSGLYVRAFLQTILRRISTAKLELTVDGHRQCREAVVLSIGNGPRSGGQFLLYPQAKNGDGYFDYLLAPPMNRLRLMWELYRSTRGRPTGERRIEYGRFVHLAISSDIPIVAHVDGEPWLRPEEGAHGLEVEVMPGALRVLC